MLQGTNATTNPQPIPTNAYLAPTASLYAKPAALSLLFAATVTNAGGSQAHLNQQPSFGGNQWIPNTNPCKGNA